jgi:hypothetical protein
LEFRITSHSGLASRTRPENAIDLLWHRLQTIGGSIDGPIDDEASFARVGRQIWVTWGPDVVASPERRERAEISRHAVAEMVRAACEQAPGLDFDWFAVGFIH